MQNYKLLSNTSEDIKYNHKQLGELEVNFYVTWKTKLRKKRTGDRNEFLDDGNESKYDEYCEDDKENTKDDNYVDFEKYNLDTDKQIL